NTNASGPGSLEQAILDANTNTGPHTIEFNLPGPGFTISPSGPLPALTESITLDGATQPGFAGSPLVEISGASAGSPGVDGIRIATGGCVIHSLAINRFSGHA